MVPRWSRSLGTLCLYRTDRWELVSRSHAITVLLACVLNLSALQKKSLVTTTYGAKSVYLMSGTWFKPSTPMTHPSLSLEPVSPYNLHPLHQIPRSDISSVPRMAHPILPRLPLPLLLHPLSPGQRKRRDNRRHDHNQTLRRCLLRRHERREA